MAVVWTYVTAKDVGEAKKIGKELVKRKLAACANVLSPMHTVYWWEGKMEEATEAVLILKTTKALRKKVEAAVKELHSYSVPCVLFLDVKSGSKDYVKWIESSVGKSR